MTIRWIPLAVLGAALVPCAPTAQSFHIIPSVDVATVADSNLFVRAADRQADVIARVSPAVDVAYRSTRLTLAGRYSVDAERFAEHSTLSTSRARQQAAGDLVYRPGRRLTIGSAASFFATQTPGELNTAAGLMLARADAVRLTLSQTMTYQQDAVTQGTVRYSFVEDRLAGRPPLAAHTAILTGARQLSRRDDGRVEYAFRAFDAGLEGWTQAHVLTAGWTRRLTRRTTLAAAVGPRLADRTLAPEASGSVAYHLEAADLSLEYTRTQTMLVGLPGAADASSLSATVASGRPAAFRLRITPGVIHTTRDDLDAVVYRLGVELSRPIAGGLTVHAGYEATLQQGDVYAATPAPPLERHVVTVRLAATPPARRRR